MRSSQLFKPPSCAGGATTEEAASMPVAPAASTIVHRREPAPCARPRSAGAVGDEIKLARARRTGGGLERSTTRIRDRSGRQTVDLVGVVRCRLLDLALHDRPAKRAFAADQAVDDGRVGLQPNL